MKEKNIDISQNTSDSIDKYSSIGINTVIRVRDNVREVCPVFNENVERIHWSIKDPFKGWNSHPDDLVNFRKTREDLTARIKNLIKSRFA